MFWGKVLGGFFGYLFLRFPGLLLGVVIGHWFDRALQQSMRQGGAVNQRLFTDTLFAVLGHLAKSKGRVTEQDIDYVNALMQHLKLNDTAREQAQKAFREGKNTDFPLDAKVSEFRRQLAWRRDILQFFIEQVLIVALHDGQLDQAEYDVLLRITEALGFRRAQLDLWLQMAQAGQRFRGGQAGTSGASAASQLDDAYAVLGVDRKASFAEVKKAYRKLMSKHHPDKLAAQGLPEEMRASAQEKAREIQAAYEVIKSQQGNGN
ncbi:Co-chaperone protein DjlA [Pseudidiomarina piscicola]|uniref:Co-chaperone protein DjlA n=1 Tax=Pseudidiomarina piscicola TaxID=2614830 RepID=A0A6S6WNH8_9GAMM|nr:co-chaperone DjlA [Pseudidiomarina piscicola]CAB0151641.1 Co-chaperone protein DjlA [Pseudidiomarina piscicola]VZT41106.1 Co-chaperone protein DjlA [Pseudomonas aeruginosa]